MMPSTGDSTGVPAAQALLEHGAIGDREFQLALEGPLSLDDLPSMAGGYNTTALSGISQPADPPPGTFAVWDAALQQPDSQSTSSNTASAVASQPPGSLPSSSTWLPITPLHAAAPSSALGSMLPQQRNLALAASTAQPVTSSRLPQAGGPVQRRHADSVSAGLAAMRLLPNRAVNLASLPPPMQPQAHASGTFHPAKGSEPSSASQVLPMFSLADAGLPSALPSAPAFGSLASRSKERASIQAQVAALQQQLDLLDGSGSQQTQALSSLAMHDHGLRSQGHYNTRPSEFVPCPQQTHDSKDPAGFPITDPGHPEHISAAMGEDYSGQRPGKFYQERRRLAGVSPVQWSGNDPLYLPGSLLSPQVGEEQRASLPQQAAYQEYISQRLATWVSRLQSSRGVFAPAHPDGAWHRQKAKFIIVRYQFLASIINHLQCRDSWGVVWHVVVMVIRDFEARDFQQCLPSDANLLTAFDISQAATPTGNKLITSLTLSLLPLEYVLEARDHALLALQDSPAAAEPSGQTNSTGGGGSQSMPCGSCGQTGHSARSCTNPPIHPCWRCGQLHKVSGKNATPCPQMPEQGSDDAAVLDEDGV